MATYDLTTSEAAAIPANSLDKFFVMRKRFDASKRNLVATDVAQLVEIKANTVVLGTMTKQVKAEGGAVTYDIGDGTGASSYQANTSGNAAVGTVVKSSWPPALTEGTPNSFTGFAGGKFYSAADTIDLTADGTMALAIIDLYVIGFTLDD
jgi:hypothetical protein